MGRGKSDNGGRESKMSEREGKCDGEGKNRNVRRKEEEGGMV